MNTLIKKMLFLSVLAGATSPAMALYYGTGITVSVENTTKFEQKIAYGEKGKPLSSNARIIEITLYDDGTKAFNPDNDKIINDSSYVDLNNQDSTFNNRILEKDQKQTSSQINYSTYKNYWYNTRIKFKILATEPGKEDRYCDINLPMKVGNDTNANVSGLLVGAIENKNTDQFLEENNKLNQGICEINLSFKHGSKQERHVSVSGGITYYPVSVPSKVLEAINIKILPD